MLTKQDISTIKTIVNEIVIDATHTVLNGVEKLLKNHPTNNDFKKLEDKVDNIETEIVFIKRDIKDIKEELSLTPSLKQFNDLKSKAAQI